MIDYVAVEILIECPRLHLTYKFIIMKGFSRSDLQGHITSVVLPKTGCLRDVASYRSANVSRLTI